MCGIDFNFSFFGGIGDVSKKIENNKNIRMVFTLDRVRMLLEGGKIQKCHPEKENGPQRYFEQFIESLLNASHGCYLWHLLSLCGVEDHPETSTRL
jgi:hypothetical protein